jgi:hypothetical protein
MKLTARGASDEARQLIPVLARRIILVERKESC